MMQRFVVAVALAGLFIGTTVSGQQTKAKAAPQAKAAAAPTGPIIVVETRDKGVFEITTIPDAPQSLAHILELVRAGSYRGLRIHWSNVGLIQFGDPTSRDMTKKDIWGSSGLSKAVGIAETSPKYKFVKGSVGLAYNPDQMPKQADSQLFVCKVANPQADNKYAPIGNVTSGMAVVEKLDVGDLIKVAYVKGETPK